ncbi:unnamed protein product, partial [Prunus brigantina]
FLLPSVSTDTDKTPQPLSRRPPSHRTGQVLTGVAPQARSDLPPTSAAAVLPENPGFDRIFTRFSNPSISLLRPSNPRSLYTSNIFPMGNRVGSLQRVEGR